MCQASRSDMSHSNLRYKDDGEDLMRQRGSRKKVARSLKGGGDLVAPHIGPCLQRQRAARWTILSIMTRDSQSANSLCRLAMEGVRLCSLLEN